MLILKQLSLNNGLCSLDDANKFYTELGIALIEEPIIDADTVKKTVKEVRRVMSVTDRFVYNTATGPSGESGQYFVLDGFGVTEYLPWLDDLYTELKPLVSKVIGEPVVDVDYPQSNINMNVFVGEGSRQCTHYDSNAVSCLIFWTEGAALEYEAFDDEWYEIYPVPGRIAIFQGKKCRHRVRRGMEGDFRAASPFNYYIESDKDRPAWMDNYIFGNRDFVDAQS